MDIWTVIIAVFILLVLVSILRAHISGKNEVSLLDLVTRDGKLSTTAILQLVGGVVGTWIIVKIAANGQMTWDLMSVYLAYVASVDGFSKVVSARYGGDRGYGSPYARRYPPIDDSAEDARPGARRTEPIE